MAVLVLWGSVETFTCPAFAGKSLFFSALHSIRQQDLKAYEKFLASDELEGREAGTHGGHKAGDYIVEKLKAWHAQPAGLQGFFQEFGSGFRNILAVVPGCDEKLKHEYVVVGAHYDHIGYGTPWNSLGQVGYVHNGADDNASGVSALLECIEAFQTVGLQPARSVLFVFWDAEEKGLLGSEHWMSVPTIPLQAVRLYINADMVGRLEKKPLTVVGTRTGAGLRRLVAEQNQGGSLRLKFPWTVKRDSDHYTFFQRRVPILFLTSGLHSDYHRPTDDVERIDFVGLEQVSLLLFRLVWAASNRTELPEFRLASFQENDELQAQVEQILNWRPERLGAQWQRTSEGTVVLTEVPYYSAAAKAGLQAGDRILRFAGVDVKQFKHFQLLVLAAKSPVSVLVERPGRETPFTLQVPLRGKPLTLGIAWREDEAEPHCVILSAVAPGSAAALAGLKPNDRIYAVDGKTFSDVKEFLKLIDAAGERLNFQIEREGQIRTVQLKLLRFKQPVAHPAQQRPASSVTRPSVQHTRAKPKSTTAP